MKYFYIQQKNGRKTVFRVYKTDYRKCELVDTFQSEDKAKDCARRMQVEEDGFR